MPTKIDEKKEVKNDDKIEPSGPSDAKKEDVKEEKKDEKPKGKKSVDRKDSKDKVKLTELKGKREVIHHTPSRSQAIVKIGDVKFRAKIHRKRQTGQELIGHSSQGASVPLEDWLAGKAYVGPYKEELPPEPEPEKKKK